MVNHDNPESFLGALNPFVMLERLQKICQLKAINCKLKSYVFK